MATIHQQAIAILMRYLFEAEEEVELEDSYSNLEEYCRMVVIIMVKKLLIARRMERHKEMSRREKMLMAAMVMMITKYSKK